MCFNKMLSFFFHFSFVIFFCLVWNTETSHLLWPWAEQPGDGVWNTWSREWFYSEASKVRIKINNPFSQGGWERKWLTFIFEWIIKIKASFFVFFLNWLHTLVQITQDEMLNLLVRAHTGMLSLLFRHTMCLNTNISEASTNNFSHVFLRRLKMMNVPEITIRAYFVCDSALTVPTTLSQLQNLVFVLLDPLDFQEDRSMSDTLYHCL